MNLKKLFFTTFLLIALLFYFTSCDNKAEESGTGSMNLKITDAPIDDANIKGAYVTVAEVKVDGVTMEGFSKQTIDLMAYQNGETKLLFNSDKIGAGAYNNIELVLDYESDQSGNGPGCYVLTDDNVKHDLSMSGTTDESLVMNRSFDITSNGTTDVVVDFDLRKSIQYDNPSHEESDYSFVSSAKLSTAVRAVIEENCGTIEGNVTESVSAGDRLVVYAYNKGEFDAEAEQDGNVKFQNAVTSASVSQSGDYQLTFLPEGEYEVHVASFGEDSGGKLVLKGMIEANSLTDNIILSDISVSANTHITLDVNALGLL